MMQLRWLCVSLFCVAAVPTHAETSRESLASWVALDAPLGYEHFATDRLAESLSGWQRDRQGNLIRRVGSGLPRRVVACGLDVHGYVVSELRYDGYLRLHRIGRGSRHALWDQAHEGQQVRVLTRSGPVVGVTAVANGHFAFQHREETSVVAADDLWVDVGAVSASAVASMGIRLLDPVVRHLPPWSYASEIAGPGAGARVGCAAVASASQGEVGSGETVFLITTQHLFGWVGLGGAVTRLGNVDEVTIVGAGESARRYETVDIDAQRRLGAVFRRAGVEAMHWVAPAVADTGALLERITVEEAEALLVTVRERAGVGSESRTEWIEAPEREELHANVGDSDDEAEVAALLERLAEMSATPGHEAPIQRVVLDAMPEWARTQAQVDELGNVWVGVGPSAPGGLSDVFVAHMDEVGYEVESIGPDGIIGLKRRGGTVASAWEGQPAKLQLASGDELDGVFLTRDAPQQKRPEQMRAWFGMDAQELESRDVRVGLGVTGYKEAHRLGLHRFTARSLDDRAGTTALLMALRQIDPSSLERRVIFAWSVQEEGGLVGAGALAERFGSETRQVFSVDTFVSSDTPLESHHFAYAPLGAGPVLRAIESSSMAPLAERDRVVALASSVGLRLQLGLTQGGTDGTRFTFWGAGNAGLSWPGRYSHSPAEVLDLGDLVGLHRLVILLAESPLD
jgi:putative aminopeptidase FrvX